MMEEKKRLTAFAPVAASSAKILILGSMPSVRSLEKQQYYAHPRNAFWPIVCALLEEDVKPYAQRLVLLQRHGIALWDTARSCLREGSSDAAIQEAEPNDFAAFFQAHSGIRHIFFNGTAAQTLFMRLVPAEIVPKGLGCTRLPSTSPAYTMPFQEKLNAWRAILPYLREDTD